MGSRNLCAANQLPSVILLPITGAIVEKHHKIKVILLCDFVRLFLVMCLLFCIFHHLSVSILLLFSFLISTAESFRIPAGNALVVQLLDEELLDRGLVLNSLSSTIAQIAGTAAGGMIIRIFSIELAFLIDAVTFIISCVIIFMIRHTE